MGGIHRAGRLLLFTLGTGVAFAVTFTAVALFFQDNRIFPPLIFPVYSGLVGLYVFAALVAIAYTKFPRSVLLGSAVGLALFGHVMWRNYLPFVEVRCDSQEGRAAIAPLSANSYDYYTPQEGYVGRLVLPVEGTPQFEASTRRVLTELLNCTPERYNEVVIYLPQAVYDPNLVHPEADDRNPRRLHGRSDGYFGRDGSGLSYYFFRYVFLHEVGHNVMWACCNDRSEEAADAYADMVLREMKWR
jgi:hypothetical protein